MKCPKCGFVSFDNIDKCKRCGNIFSTTAVASQNKVIKLNRIADEQKAEKIDKSISTEVIKKSPIPVIDQAPVENESFNFEEDDFDLITERPVEHVSLDKLPVLQRFISFAIDLGILLFINFTLIVASALIIGTSLISLWSMKLYFALLFLLMYYLYFIYFTLIYNATPGQLIMHIRLISLASLKPTRLTFPQVSWRWLSMISGIALLMIGIIYMLFDNDNATLHDRLSLTLVVNENQFNALKIEESNR
jgi:uncharacterized RDD family membrane protein YckC